MGLVWLGGSSVHKCASLAMVVLAGQAGSVVAISNH